MERAKPPEDITPREFFTRWIPEAVAGDEDRQRRLGDTEATIVFDVSGTDDGVFTLSIRGGSVTASAGNQPSPDLRVEVDLETWRMLNQGQTTAPQAMLRRRVKLHGDFLLGLKLHMILG